MTRHKRYALPDLDYALDPASFGGELTRLFWSFIAFSNRHRLSIAID